MGLGEYLTRVFFFLLSIYLFHFSLFPNRLIRSLLATALSIGSRFHARGLPDTELYFA